MDIQIISVIFEILFGTSGVTSELLQKIKKSKKQGLNSDEILNSFNDVQKQLNEAQTNISDLLDNVEKQKNEFLILKEKAELNQQTVDFTEDEVKTIEKLLERSVAKESKKSAKLTIFSGLIFAVIGAVIGFLLSAFLN